MCGGRGGQGERRQGWKREIYLGSGRRETSEAAAGRGRERDGGDLTGGTVGGQSDEDERRRGRR